MLSTESYNLCIEKERNVRKNIICLHTGLSLSHVTGFLCTFTCTIERFCFVLPLQTDALICPLFWQFVNVMD